MLKTEEFWHTKKIQRIIKKTQWRRKTEKKIEEREREREIERKDIFLIEKWKCVYQNLLHLRYTIIYRGTITTVT